MRRTCHLYCCTTICQHELVRVDLTRLEARQSAFTLFPHNSCRRTATAILRHNTMLGPHILLAVIIFQATDVAHSAAIPRFVHAPNATPPGRLARRDVTSVQTIVTTVTKPVATAVVDKYTTTVTSFSFGPRGHSESRLHRQRLEYGWQDSYDV